MGLDKKLIKLDIDSQSALCDKTLEILQMYNIKSKYMKKYDLTHQEYVDCVSIAKDWALEQGLSFTREYFNNAMVKRQKLINLFTKK